MKKATLLLLFGLAITISLNAQNSQEKQLVIIRVVEFMAGFPGGGLLPVMHITENDGSYRIIELDKHSKKYLLESTDNQKKLHRELKKYIQDGYEIVGHAKGLEGLPIWYENYVLIKN